jgi:hypothetical protein
MRASRAVETRYVRVSVDARGLGIVAALNRLVTILNKEAPGLGWDFATTFGDVTAFDYLIYRDVELEDEFASELDRLRDFLGGSEYAREADVYGRLE